MRNDDAPRSQSGSMAEQIKAQQEAHQDQFDIATEAAISRGFQRWFEDTWSSAKAKGALPNPFISSMFVFMTAALLRKFTARFSEDMPIEMKEQAIADAKQMMIGYLDQMEAAEIKLLHNPPRCPKCFGPLPCPEHTVTSKGKQTIILPEKKRFKH